jgi:hypothetical protein
MTDEERQKLLERAKQNLRDLEKFRALFNEEEYEQRQDMFLKDVSRWKKKN